MSDNDYDFGVVKDCGLLPFPQRHNEYDPITSILSYLLEKNS